MSQKNLLHQQEYIENLRSNSRGLQQLLLNLTSSKSKLRKMRGNQSFIERMQIVCEKIELQLKKYEQSIKKCRTKMMSKGAISSMKMYFNQNFNTLVRESNHILNANTNANKNNSSANMNKTGQSNFRKVREFQNQICEDWDQTVYEPQQKQKNRQTTEIIDRNNLQKQASSHLHQEFLAIRMIAYKMYEDYSGHSHSSLYKELKEMQEEQGKLHKQLQEAKIMRTELLTEEKRMQEELKELKKINQLVGRRYFMERSHTDTNFTTN